MSGYSKMDSTVQQPDPDQPIDPQTKKPDPEPVMEMKPKLSRNRSVSASGQAVPSTMKTSAMSMRRSSSVSERYCRIYDQSSATWPLPSYEEDEDEDNDDNKEKVQKKKIKKKSFVKACKRFFGIS